LRPPSDTRWLVASEAVLETHARPACLVVGLAVDDAVVEHHQQHDVAPRDRLLHVDRRRVGRRRLDEPGDERGLGHVEFVGVLAEEAQGGRLDAVVPVAEVGLVQVQREDFVLGVGALDQQRREGFLDLARVRLLPVEERHAGELLRDRAAALRPFAGARVGDDGRTDAHQVDPVVLVEALVLDRDDGLAHRLADLLERHLDALFLEDGEHRLVALVVERGRLRHVAHRRQGTAVGQRATDVPGERQPPREGDPGGQRQSRQRPREGARPRQQPAAQAAGVLPTEPRQQSGRHRHPRSSVPETGGPGRPQAPYECRHTAMPRVITPRRVPPHAARRRRAEFPTVRCLCNEIRPLMSEFY
jgi:hypothetical protein